METELRRRSGPVRFGLPDGTPFDAHPGFLAVVFFLTMTFWREFSLAGLVVASGVTIVIVASITLHELAHKWMAERHNIRCSGVELNGFGGVALAGC